MNKLFLLFLLGILCLCACKSPKEDLGTLSVEINPLIPNTETELTLETLKKNTENSISGLSKAYNKMQTWKKTDPDFSKGIKKADKVDQTYSDRITEILSLDLSSLTEEELINLSDEIPDLVSKIREVNDLFELR